MPVIDLSNFANTLVQSSASRAGVDDGNIFFDVANGRIELITAEELANVDLHSGADTGLVTIDANVAGTLTLQSGTWKATHGIWKVGAVINIAGFVDTDINGNHTIASVNGAVLTVTDATGWSTEAGTGNEQVTSVTQANPLIEDDGIKIEALYAFERQERRVDETLRQYDFFFKGTFKFGGAYELVNGRKFDDANGSATSLTTDDRFKLRGSGWIERDANGAIGRILFGSRSLGNIEPLSQPYYQLLEGGAPVNFDKDGPIDEPIFVYGDSNIDTNVTDSGAVNIGVQIDIDTAARTLTRASGSFVTDGFLVGEKVASTGFTSANNNIDHIVIESVTALVITYVDNAAVSGLTNETGSGDEVLTVSGFDKRYFLSNKVRTYGQNPDEKQLGDSGLVQMDGYASGFALGESPHLTTVPATYPLANVYGGGQTSPWTGMTLEKLAAPQTETGFTTADGNFTWVLNNTVPGDLDQCIAFIDALQQTDDDIDSGAITVTRGKRVGTWYSYDADGTIRFDAPFAGEGFFVEQLVGTDKNRVAFQDDASASKVYPAYSNVTVFVGADAVADALAWFHAFFLAGIGAQAGNDFNTANAITVQDPTTALIKGNVDGTGFSVGNNIVFEFDHAGDTVGGTAGANKDCVFECEGDGGVTAAKTIFTLTNAASITATCQPAVETNV